LTSLIEQTKPRTLTSAIAVMLNHNTAARALAQHNGATPHITDDDENVEELQGYEARAQELANNAGSADNGLLELMLKVEPPLKASPKVYESHEEYRDCTLLLGRLLTETGGVCSSSRTRRMK
jgi:hypothetical protein